MHLGAAPPSHFGIPARRHNPAAPADSISARRPAPARPCHAAATAVITPMSAKIDAATRQPEMLNREVRVVAKSRRLATRRQKKPTATNAMLSHAAAVGRGALPEFT